MRIGIVNDMLMAREALRRAVSSVPGLDVAWLARDGLEAVEKRVVELEKRVGKLEYAAKKKPPPARKTSAAKKAT